MDESLYLLVSKYNFIRDFYVITPTNKIFKKNKRLLATGPPTPRLYGKIKFWNYCKLEVQVNLYHSPDLNNSEREPPKDHFEVKKGE